MFFATRKIKEVDEFLITNFLMVTNLKDHIPYYAEIRNELRKYFRDLMEELFYRDSYNKSFTSVVKVNKSDSPEKRVSNWVFSASNKGPIPNNVYGCSWNDMFELFTKILKQPGKYDKNLGRYSINEVLTRV